VVFKTLSVLTFSLIASVAFAQAGGSASAAPKRDEAKTPVLTRAQFDQLLAKPEQLLIVDVRRPDELTSIGSFPVYLSVQLADLEKSVAWIPKDRKVVAVSNHAGRAGRAADLLASKGFNVVGRIGVQTYEEEGGKIAHITAPAPQKTASSAPASAK